MNLKEQRKNIILTILTVVMIFLAIASESVYFSDFENHFRTKRFNRIIKEKERIMEDCLNGMKPLLALSEMQGPPSETTLYTIAEQNGITILEYFGNRLAYWSDNEFDVPGMPDDSLFTRPLLFIQNGWFMPKTVEAGDEKIIGLLRIRTDYGFENDIVKNGFDREFAMPEYVGFSINREDSEFHVMSEDGIFLFSLLFPEDKGVTPFLFIPLLFWIISFFLVISLSLSLVKYLIDRIGKKTVPLCLLVFAIIYFVILLTHRPAVFFQTELFSPYRYTINSVLPSMGHILILSVLLSVWSFVFLRYFPLGNNKTRSSLGRNINISLLLFVGALMFIVYHILFRHLVFSSNINFEPYKILDLDMLSLAGFISLILLFLVPFFYILKVFRILRESGSGFPIIPLLVSMFIFIIFFIRETETLFLLAFFYFTVNAAIWFMWKGNTGLFNRTMVVSMIFCLYLLYIITSLSEKKTAEKIKIQLVTYSTENDPDAEHLLLDMWPAIFSDTLLAEMMNREYFEKSDFEDISDYLHDNYFTGYWGNFNLNIVLCTKVDSLKIGEPNETFEDCFMFFNDKIMRSGHKITGTEFYFIDNKIGRSNYLGRFFFDNRNGNTNGLYIDLLNDINLFQPGYSEILLDKKYHGYARLKDYSFAKYVNGEIVLRTGEYPYFKTDAQYTIKNTDYTIFNGEGYNHVLYKNGNVTVIISRPLLSAGDIIISFAYLFAFIIIFSGLILFMIHNPRIKNPGSFNFRQKLQMSFIGILLFSFILISLVIASLAVRQSRTKHYENIKEKLNSVYIELESRISDEKTLSSDWQNSSYGSLNEVLVKLSNVFNTDINLYDLNGYLIATSRPEIFYRNLTSRRMNMLASINLENLTRSEYFQTEKIGKLEYISAYVPFYNNNNELLIYLNLPYFRLQSVLAKEISNLIVAVINFTLLLIVIAMSLAVFISSRLTSPLTMLSSRLASVELGKKSEHLSYNGKDEVGDLVRQYNRMVDELDESVQKLANSEREYAWREMAKQIAHEIKNPLTPMKLNVQQLFKSWKDGVPGFEKKLERFTKNQIVYIDNLSSIASAFSSFAKMPGANPAKIDLLEQIKTTLELFKNSENIAFRIGCRYDAKVCVFADKEHLNGIFSNLIKNGIQSIPPGKEGLIKVFIDIKDEKVLVSVSDNGTGIPESIQKKMFTPNFTTKSSGTGLGLSIVKRYVENANGRIWFESVADKGSVFFIELPVCKD